MRSTFLGIEIAKTGLAVSQKGLDITGHNIANVDTPGYTRQRIVDTSREPFNSVPIWRPVDQAMVGYGARVVILDQIRSSFLDRQFRTEQSLYSNWAVRTQGLTYVESLFESEEGTTIEDSINNLFSAFLTLSDQPDSMSTRVNVFNAASYLCENLNSVHERLLSMQEDQSLCIDALFLQINTLAQGIADLNKAIYAYEIEGQPANDLRDKRNLLVDQLSALADITYTSDAIGAEFKIELAGHELVNHVKVNTLQPLAQSPDPVTGLMITTYEWVNHDGSNWDFDLDMLKSGELRAHYDLRDSADPNKPGIPYFIEKLNTLARGIVDSINKVQLNGYTHALSPIGSVKYDPLTGTNKILFFHDEDGNLGNVTAGNIRLSDALYESVFNIAASSREIRLEYDENGIVYAPNGEPLYIDSGNQENARAFYQLSFNGVMFSAGGKEYSIGTLGDYYKGIVLDVALTLQQSKKKAENYSVQLLSADTQRTSISGVSMDEEMTGLIEYQRAYQGASRVITTMDDILDMIINRMGRVGL